MERLLVLFYALICIRAELIIYPDQYHKMRNPVRDSNQEISKTWYNSPTIIHPFNATYQNKISSLHDVFLPSRSDNVTNIISKGITKFALDMDNAIYKTRNNSTDGKKKENVVFSPLSLAGTMAIVLLAAGGKTFDEVAKILGLESGVDVSRNSEVVHEMFGLLIGKVDTDKGSTGLQAAYANGIFIQEGYPIRPEFQTINQNVYKSEIINIDFHNHGEEAMETVNKWVNNRTMGKISQILSSVPSPETDVILASALYFNGEWDQYFIDSATMRRPFNIEPGQTVIVDMMYNGADFPFYEDKQLGVKILGLPYKGLEVTMYVLLPTTPGANALKEFETSLNPDILDNLIHNIKNQTCIVGFPRMKLSSTLSLKRALQSLGLITLFDPVKADLSLLSPGLKKTRNSGLKISDSRGDSDDSQIDAQQLRPQDGFYFPPRIGENRQENKSVNSDHLGSRKHYFRYEDKLRGYSVEQWDNGYNIKRNRRAELKSQRTEASDTASSAKESSQTLSQHQQQKKKKKEEDSRQKRQNRPIDQGFLDFLNSKNLPSFGLDSLRNSANIENPGLYAEDVLHRVEININEKGTEAAAATAIALERTGSQKKFIANSPFLFFIRHDLSKLIWFWGTVNSPTPNYP